MGSGADDGHPAAATFPSGLFHAEQGPGGTKVPAKGRGSGAHESTRSPPAPENGYGDHLPDRRDGRSLR